MTFPHARIKKKAPLEWTAFNFLNNSKDNLHTKVDEEIITRNWESNPEQDIPCCYHLTR